MTIKPEHLKALIVLERYCRDKVYAWPRNKEFAKKYGCRDRQAQNLLRELEELGYIRRIVCEPDIRLGGGTRQGIVLRRRLNLDLPIVDDDSLPASIERLRASRGMLHDELPAESVTGVTEYVGGRTALRGRGVTECAQKKDSFRNRDTNQERISPRKSNSSSPTPYPAPPTTGDVEVKHRARRRREPRPEEGGSCPLGRDVEASEVISTLGVESRASQGTEALVEGLRRRGRKATIAAMQQTDDADTLTDPGVRDLEPETLARLDRANPPSGLPPVTSEISPSKKSSSPPESPPTGDKKSQVLNRVAVVFGREVAEKLNKRWPSFMYDIRGRHDALLAAVAKCEIDEFLPNEPLTFLRKLAQDYAHGGKIPEWIEEQLRKPPESLLPKPVERKYFSAADIKPRPDAIYSPSEVVKVAREAMKAKIPESSNIADVVREIMKRTLPEPPHA